MGKPQHSSYRDDPSLDDAVSLHTTHGGDDYQHEPESSRLLSSDAVPDSSASPPAYTDEYPPQEPLPQYHVESSDSHMQFMGRPVNQVQEVQSITDQRCDTDPDYLAQTVTDLSKLPPSPMICILGQHSETRRRGDKKETHTVTDFKIYVNMTPWYLLNYGRGPHSWSSFDTVENDQQTFRGGFRKTKAPQSKGQIEVGVQRPSLREWCHLYCASHSKLKIFRLTRRPTGCNQQYLKSCIEGLIRSTEYRGHVHITFPVRGRAVDIYSTNCINEWRLTTWIRWVFYLTFLWIFTWPYLYFSTKRYNVVETEWPFSKPNSRGETVYATISEEEWFTKFSPALRNLILDRFQGDAACSNLEEILRRPDRRQEIRTGHDGVDSAVNFLQAGFRAASDMNRALTGRGNGWGYDC